MISGQGRTPTPLGELAADLFLQRLRGQGFRTSNRHVVDYLPADVGQPLFDALIELADQPVTLRIPTDGGADRSESFLAIREAHYDIVPFLVSDAPRGRHNVGSEGFASCLRDHYSIDADRPRLLVVVTVQGNETQKSAQDALADQALVTLDLLLESVLDGAGIARDAPLAEVARVYRAHQPADARWPRVVERFESYVDEVTPLSPREQGARLPKLGCFLPDSRPDFSAGERVKVLEDKDQRRRQRGEGRLFDNALMHEFLSQAFNDPIVDAEHVLSDVFEDHPEKAKAIARGGAAGLANVELETFAGMGQRRQHRQKNGLDRGSLDVVGATFHRSFGAGKDTIIVVSAAQRFTLTFKLTRAFNDKKERAQVVSWDATAQKFRLEPVLTANGALSVSFPVEPDSKSGFSVSRVALTRGPRSLSTAPRKLVVITRPA